MTRKEKIQEFKRSKKNLVKSMLTTPGAQVHYRFRMITFLWYLFSALVIVLGLTKWESSILNIPTWLAVTYFAFTILTVIAFISDMNNYLIVAPNFLGVVNWNLANRMNWEQVVSMHKHDSTLGMIFNYGILDFKVRTPSGKFMKYKFINVGKISKITSKWFKETAGQNNLVDENLILRKWIYEMAEDYLNLCNGKFHDCMYVNRTNGTGTEENDFPYDCEYADMEGLEGECFLCYMRKNYETVYNFGKDENDEKERS